MTAVFLKVVNMSITASWLIIAVIVLRLLLKRSPRMFCCILWGMVALRLIMPFSFESVLSTVPNASVVASEFFVSDEQSKDEIKDGVSIDSAVNTENPSNDGFSDRDQNVYIHNNGDIWLRALSSGWIIGGIIIITCGCISCFMLKKRLRVSIKGEENIYICDGIRTPFVFGFFRPLIYLPSDLTENQLKYVLSHEKTHIKKLDHIWKLIGFMILAVYWFNPLVWVAYLLFCRDLEYACDESVIKSFGPEDIKQYSETLLYYSVPTKMTVYCPVAFGEVCVKERIKKVLNYKKPTVWIILFLTVVCVAVAVFFMTDPVMADTGETDPGETKEEFELLAPEVYEHDASMSFNYEVGYFSEGYLKGDPYYKRHVFRIQSRKQIEELFAIEYNSNIKLGLSVYDDEYFKDNEVLVVLFRTSSGSHTFNLSGFENDGKKIKIDMVYCHPECQTCDIGGWMITISVKKAAMKYVEKFEVSEKFKSDFEYSVTPIPSS